MDVLKLAFALALCGCLEPQATTCASLLCPEGTFCTPGGCATLEAIHACDGKVDGDACMTSEITFDGYCSGGACQQSVCGNGKQEYGEVCDDGNREPGDGCSVDCLSNETCGNGVVDVLAGEQCDRGVYGLAADGCSSTCSLEFDTWTSATPPPLIGRYGAAGALDALGRVVVFGGISNNDLFQSDTWEWDGTSWIERFPLHVPPARAYAMIAYDAQRHRTVMFGGALDNGKATDDLWEWDGVDWIVRNPANMPAARFGGAMAADPMTAGRVILYGGDDGNGTNLCGASAWDGSTWTTIPIGPLGGSAGCQTSAAASHTGELVVFDGTDTYLWSGTGNWVKYGGTEPPARSNAAMAYDPQPNDRILLFGGIGSANVEKGDVWQWKNGMWTPLDGGAMCGSALPCARDSTLLATDPASGVFMHGGRTTTGLSVPVVFTPLNDSYRWSTDQFTRVGGVTSPSVRSGAATAYDPLRGVMILHGGSGPSTADADTWQWDGTSWQQLASSSQVRTLHAMTYDRANHVTMVVGGNDGTNELLDTMLFDGTMWMQAGGLLSPPHQCSSIAPARRVWLAYDDALGKVVLFRGVGGQPAASSQTLTWNGSGWDDVTPTPSPPARLEAAMAYDAARHQIVVFGGEDCSTGSRMADTWLFDGTTWTKASPATSPTRRTGPSMTYDERTQRVILFGGVRVDGALGDTWAWDGMNWTQLALPVTPDPRFDAALAFDAIRANVVLFGGTLTTGAVTNEVWTYRFHSAAFPPDTCTSATGDTDGDGLKGCNDPDCQGRCDPLCRPDDTGCPASRPTCGDGACSPLEDYELCPADCTPP